MTRTVSRFFQTRSSRHIAKQRNAIGLVQFLILIVFLTARQPDIRLAIGIGYCVVVLFQLAWSVRIAWKTHYLEERSRTFEMAIQAILIVMNTVFAWQTGNIAWFLAGLQCLPPAILYLKRTEA